MDTATDRPAYRLAAEGCRAAAFVFVFFFTLFIVDVACGPAARSLRKSHAHGWLLVCLGFELVFALTAAWWMAILHRDRWRFRVGNLLIALSWCFNVGLFLYSLVVCFHIAYDVSHVLAFVGLAFFPTLLVAAPVYALLVYGLWGPLLLVYGGFFAGFVAMAIATVIRGDA